MFKDKAVLFDHGLFFDFGHFGHFFVWAGNLTFLGAFPNADRQSWMHITRRLEKGIGVLTFRSGHIITGKHGTQPLMVYISTAATTTTSDQHCLF